MCSIKLLVLTLQKCNKYLFLLTLNCDKWHVFYWLIIPNQSFAWWGFDFDLCANKEINVRWEQNGPNQGKDLSRERKNEERQTTIARLFANKCTPKIKNENWAQYIILSLWPFSLWWSSWYCLYQFKLK